jgi:SSS family solute:Na+ symporter
MILKLIIIGAYSAMIIVIGILGLKRTKSFADFSLGGGKIGPWMSAFSYGTAYFSAVLFIGYAGKIGWGFGYSGMWIAVFNSLLGVLAVWGLMGWRIKRVTSEMGITTLSEYLEKRYDSRFLKGLAALSIFVFLIPYSAAVFQGLGFLFQENFNISMKLAVILIGIFTAVYLVLGGYKSMAMIDLVFGIIMVIGVGILLFFTLDKGGGLPEITRKLSAIDPKLVKAVGPPGAWPLFTLVFLTSVAPFAMPQLIQKFYAIKDQRSVRIGMAASTVFAVLIVTIVYFVGSTTRIFIPPDTPAIVNSETGGLIFDNIMPVFLGKVIPGPLMVIILLLVLAASMSTLAALVLISSSSLARDFYKGFIDKQVSDRNLTLLTRALSAVFIVLAVVFARAQIAAIVEILGISWGAIGSVFLGPFVWGLFYRDTEKTGAISGALLGLGVCLVMYFSGRPSPEAGTVGMMVSLVVTFLVSSAVSFLRNKRK